MNRKKLVSASLIMVVLLIMAIGVFFMQQSKNTDQTADTSNSGTTNTEETEEMPAAEGFVLSELPEGSYEIQDNTLTDTWGVVLKVDQLPNELKEAEEYTITIGDKSYELAVNPYNDEVFNGQVSSIDHTKEQVGTGVVSKN